MLFERFRKAFRGFAVRSYCVEVFLLGSFVEFGAHAERAWRTIAGYEAIHMIRKGQAYGSAAGAKIGLLHRFILGLFAASN